MGNGCYKCGSSQGEPSRLCPSCNKKRRQERSDDFDGDKSSRTERSSSNDDWQFDQGSSSDSGKFLRYVILFVVAAVLIYGFGFYPGGPAVFIGAQ